MMIGPDIEVALLIGLGSVGRTHLKYLSERFNQVCIIDPNNNVLEQIEIDSEKFFYFESEKEFIQSGKIPNLCVISNWGPDHFRSLVSISKLGTKRFIVEKPLVSKIEDLYIIQNLVISHNLRIFMHTPWVFSIGKQKLEMISNKLNLGKVMGYTVVGGAKCLATNGIHYLAFVINMMGKSPQHVWSKYSNSEINPRSKRFKFLEGTFFFDFGNGQTLTITFSNSSRNQAQMFINFENGFGTLVGDILTVYKISEENLSLNAKPSKAFYANELVYQENLFIDNDGSDGTKKIYDLILSESGDGFNNAKDTMVALFLALLSGNTDSKLLNLNELQGQGEIKFYEWNIS